MNVGDGGRLSTPRLAAMIVVSLGLVAAVSACAGGPSTANADGATEAAAAPPIVVAEGGIDPSAFGSYLAGRLARSERDTASAATFLLDALGDDPENQDLRIQVFNALVLDERFDDALTLADELVEEEATAALPGLALALRHVRDKDFDAAAERITTLSRSGYNAVLLPLIEAWVTVGRGDVEGAIEVLGTLGSEGGFQAFRSFHEALILDLLGDKTKAEASYRVALEAQPNAFRVVEALGGYYERTGRLDEANALYEDFRVRDPDSPWLEAIRARLAQGTDAGLLVADPAAGISEVLFGVASALQQEDAPDAALVYAHLATFLTPTSDATALLIGDINETLSRFEEAIEAYRRISPTSPLAWTARIRIAVIHDVLDRTDEATRELDTMAAERPDRADALVTLGDLWRGRQRWPEAIGAYDRALERIGTPEQRHWRLFYARGVALERTQQWPKAEADFLKALELEPEHPFVLNYLGYSWVDQGVNLDEALDMIERAVDQRPNDGFIVDSLGWAYFRLDKFDLAVKHLERAVELEPDDPTINDHLGDALWQVGRHAEAYFQWRRAMALKPEDALAQAIRAKLEHGLAVAPAINGDG
ncbi:MAG: tetratricopeptide repeat protein [Alphaproteobacteria bacterium]|nr:tetratricopeptide repeat protein [Alphaproteobacteria bacterium]